jgi:protein SCO1
MLLLPAAFAAAQNAPASMPPPTLPDVVVQTQSGESVHFASGLVKGRTVAVNFIFTSCGTVCPLMGASFSRVQSLLGDRPGDVRLISISIDPATDTPARLATWGRRFGLRPGWTLVTGSKNDVDRLLKAFGVYTPDRVSHAAVAIIGNDATGTWRRIDGLAPPSTIVAIVKDVATPRVAGAAR